jgi:type II secretory pathway pseudopilin PulG
MDNLSVHSVCSFPRFRDRFRQGTGVSLLELLVVLAMISILAVTAMSGISGFIVRNSLLRQTDQLSVVIRRTRDMALEQAHPWRLVFQPGKGSWMGYGDADDDGQKDPGEMTLGPFILTKGVFFGCTARSGPNRTALPGDGVSFTDNQICFSSMGCCNSGSIYLTDRGSSTAVRVMPASGAVRVWQYRGSWKEL